MFGMPRLIVLYILAILTLGIGLALYCLVRYPWSGDLATWLLFAAFAVLTLLADRYGLHFARGTHVHVDTIPLFASVLIFSPPYVMLITTIARIFGRIGQGRQARERIFNVGMTLTYVAISSIAIHTFVPTPWRPGGPGAWLGWLVAGIAMYLLNTGLVAGIVSLNAHVPVLRIWGASLSPALLEHLVMFSFGTLTALVVVPYPWGLIFVAGPSVAIFVMLDRTLRMEAQHQQLAEQNAGLATYLSEQAAQLHEAYQTLEKTLDTKNKLLFNIFQTLRSPLTAIAGRGVTVRRKLAAGEAIAALEELDILLHNAEMVQHFVKEFVSLQVLERRQLLLEAFSVEDLFQDVLSTAQVEMLCAEIDVFADYEAGLPRLYADRGRLKQMFVQLLDNAVRFSTPGEKVELVARRESNELIRISVTDHGKGIPAAQLAAIFDWFTNVDAATASASGSHGLGLAIARRVAELHGGAIQVTSQPGQGTTVTVTLPFRMPGTGSA